MTILEKSPIYQEIWGKGRQEGRQESRQELLRTLKRSLHRRLGLAPMGLVERVDALTISQLVQLTVDGAEARDWDDFLRRLEQVETGVGEM